MKNKKTLLLLLIFGLMACGTGETSAASSNSSDIGTLSETPTSISSEKQDESSAQTSSTSSAAEEGEVKTAATVSANDVPTPAGQGYPANCDIEVGGVTFSVSSVQQNTGKFKKQNLSVIQMKASEGYILNKTPLKANLKIRIVGVSYSYSKWDDETQQTITVGNDNTVCPTVYVGNSADNVSEKLVPAESVELHENATVYDYTFPGATSYKYFKIINESEFAQYVESFVWGN